jgi:hypothetical protein
VQAEQLLLYKLQRKQLEMLPSSALPALGSGIQTLKKERRLHDAKLASRARQEEANGLDQNILR